MADEQEKLVVEEVSEADLAEAKKAALAEAKKAEEDKPLTQEVSVSDAGSCLKHVKVTVPRAEVQRYFDKEVGKMIRETNIPGFRPGKTPRRLIERKFREEASGQVRIALLSKSMQQIDEEKRYDPVMDPELDAEAVVLPEEGDFIYEFDVEVRPEFVLPNFRDLVVKRPTRVISDSDVETEIEHLRDRLAKESETDEAARAGDFLVCDLRTLVDGTVTAEQNSVRIRLENSLLFNDAKVENFNQQMAGVRNNDTKLLGGQISDEAENPAAAGKPFTVEIVVEKVLRAVRPEMDEVFFKEFDVGDLGELKDWVRSVLERRFRQMQLDKVRKQVVEQLLKNTKIDLPQKLLRRQADAVLRKRVMELSDAGYDEDYIRAEVNGLRQQSLANTAYFMRERFLLESIAQQEKIEITDEDYSKEIESIAEQYGESVRKVRGRIEQDGLAEGLMSTLLERKTIDRVVAESTATEEVMTESLHRASDAWAVDLKVAPAMPALVEPKAETEQADGVEEKQPAS